MFKYNYKLFDFYWYILNQYDTFIRLSFVSPNEINNIINYNYNIRFNIRFNSDNSVLNIVIDI